MRGLEAITASFPPIPTVSILRRRGNQGIATWGQVMNELGYRSSFLYGGYGYFDDMNSFFAGNGFQVLDRTDIENVRFENVWGVSDEDLFDRAIQHYDEQYASGKPFFSIIMTTSNHKPYTFRPGLEQEGIKPEGGGRQSGVRYADYALAYFLREAAKQPWFDNTVFVVVADHGARVYGKAEIPLETYEIPLMIYSPKHLAPRQVDTLMTQIDIAPTVLGLLGSAVRGAVLRRGHPARAARPFTDCTLQPQPRHRDPARQRDRSAGSRQDPRVLSLRPGRKHLHSRQGRDGPAAARDCLFPDRGRPVQEPRLRVRQRRMDSRLLGYRPITLE